MKKHIRIYFKYHNIGEQDIVLCEECGSVAVDIHHKKKRSQGGGDNIENLQALCRFCHLHAHNQN